MSAVLLEFPRGRALHADLDREQVLRRCRVAAIVHGCTRRQIEHVLADAGELLDTGARPDYVVAVAKAHACGLAARDNPKGCA